MISRMRLLTLAQQHGLDASGTQRLLALAGTDAEPVALRRLIWPVVAALAAGLGGLGLILWLAANWESMDRLPRFALLQALLVLLCAAMAWRPALRAPLGLAALLSLGGLLAFFGQTYQTGADPWQLFALWAALALPLAVAVRHDLVWTPWALVAATAISLALFAHTGHRWRIEPGDLGLHLLAWLGFALLVAWLSPLTAAWTGAGRWSMRGAATLAVVAVTLTALGGLFQRGVGGPYPLGLAVFALAGAVLCLRRCFEVYLLSAVAMGLNTLLVTGLARWLFEGRSGDPIGLLFAIGLVAAGLLAASVSLIMRLARRQAEEHARASQGGTS